MTVTELSDKMYVTPQVIYKYLPSAYTIYIMSRIFGCTTDEIFDHRGKKK